jgi:hypothetical protein
MRRQLGGRTPRLTPYMPVSSGGRLVTAGQIELGRSHADHLGVGGHRHQNGEEYIMDLVGVSSA